MAKYYRDERVPQTLLRRQNNVDELFSATGEWVPTKLIVDYEFGNNDHVDAITESEARKLAPRAFN